MPKKMWLCDKCGRAHEEEDEAKLCEAEHWGGIDDRTEITGVGFKPRDRWRPHAPQHVPDFITVKFTDKHGDLARYQLMHYGHKGL
jgi:hypothetical protein